jgi:transposase InsO family protein
MHSDRGSQYARLRYQNRLEQYKMIPNMSRKCKCWDNASMERFFRNLKSERVSNCRFKIEKKQGEKLLTTFHTTIPIVYILLWDI